MHNLLIVEAQEDELQKFKNWGEELMTSRKSEAVASLKKEGVSYESAHLIDLNNKKYIIYSRISSEKPKPADVNMPINQKHKAQNRAVQKPETRQFGEEIYSLSNP